MGNPAVALRALASPPCSQQLTTGLKVLDCRLNLFALLLFILKSTHYVAPPPVVCLLDILRKVKKELVRPKMVIFCNFSENLIVLR